MTFVLNLIFYPFFILVTAGMFALFLFPLLALRGLAGERKALRVLRYVICGYGWIVVRILPFPFVRIHFRNAEKGKPRGACVYVCNHRSSSDAFLMALLNREVVQVVNRWPFKIPLIGWVAECAGYLSIRSMPFEEFLEKACGLLKQGVSLVAFPEGSRSADRTLHQFNGAVFRVAQAAQVPVVPLCLSGNQRIPEKGSMLLKPGKIRVHQLPALEWESFKDFSPFKLKNTVRAMIQAEVDRLECL